MQFERAYRPQDSIDNMIADACARWLDPANREEADQAMKRSDWTPDELRKAVRKVVEEEASWPVFKNDRYTVCVREADHINGWPTLICLSIKRNDRKTLHDWRELQAIKNAIVGEECEAVELYPAESRKVDTELTASLQPITAAAQQTARLQAALMATPAAQAAAADAAPPIRRQPEPPTQTQPTHRPGPRRILTGD